MRLLCLLLLGAIAPISPVHAQEASRVFDLPEAGLSIELPRGFYLARSLDEALPDFAGYFFQDGDDATRVRLLHVTLHTYFDADQRAAWLSGETAERRLAHLASVRRVDPSAFALPASVAYRLYPDEVGWTNYVLFGCDEARCYRVDVHGPADLQGSDAQVRDLLAGVRFDP